MSFESDSGDPSDLVCLGQTRLAELGCRVSDSVEQSQNKMMSVAPNGACWTVHYIRAGCGVGCNHCAL